VPGLYSVSLTASNAVGADVHVETDYVCVVAAAPGIVHGLRIAGDRRTLSWDAEPDATSYDVERGDLGSLQAGLQVAVTACVASRLRATTADDPTPPPPGGGFFYVVRGVNCAVAGTFDSGSTRQLLPRDEAILGSPGACP
jgi:PKD repeat protein